MKRLVFHNLGWKLLSLAIAVVLWYVQAREPELTALLNVPVEFRGMPDDLVISSDLPEHVRIEIRGASERIARDNLSSAAVVLDFATVTGPGERTITLQDRNLRLPTGVRFYRAVPSQITLKFEHRTYKTIPIRARYLTSPEPGAVLNASFEPVSVRVVGPESRVQPLDAVPTDPIDLANVSGHAEFRVHLNVGDPQVRLDPFPQVLFRITLARRDGR